MLQSVRSRTFRGASERSDRVPGKAATAQPLLLILLLAIPALAQKAAVETSTSAAPASAPPAAIAPGPGTAAAVDPFAQDFLRLCAGCHTIGGGGLTGPDLLPATSWPREDLRLAVKRMEKNVGPMSDEQVDGLAGLLKKPDLKALLAAAAERRVEEMAATLDPGDPAVGSQLFFGARPLANGGIACFACHTAAGRGGNMARDLTMAHQRLGRPALLSATEKPAFPMMAAAYGTRPVTAQEAAHLAAFLEQTTASTTPARAAQPQTEALGLAHAGAGGMFLIVVAGVAVLARRRRAGVRSRMVRDSQRR
ncbi:MAG TPA: hypothetical protein VLV48_10125 [Thermoanaerobaculia bacterium]|nr:hypothetical protein [Thermoanaerobaculia bacterium]